MPASPKYEYRRNLPHFQKSDAPLFVTFRTYKDWHLPPSAQDIAQRHCRGEHGRTIDLHAGVIMPSHVHLLFTPLRDADGWPFTLAHILKVVKGRSAWEINKTLQRHGPVWQDEFFDHVLRSDESLRAKTEYILQNPIRAGLVRGGEQYPWCWEEDVPIA
jgi:REP element-mobilizing transposase RayT